MPCLEQAQGGGTEKFVVSGLCQTTGVACEMVHDGLYAAALQRHARQLQAHFAARHSGDQGQVVAVAQVANAEHAAFDFAQARAQ
jgi:hypothetical protein